MILTPGARLGPYEILAPVGAGGMGEVWKARDTRLGRTVAIKVSRSEFTARFEREARAVAALNHPNICTLHDVGPDYLVMELVEGAPIKGPVAVETAIVYARQALDALAAAHRKGIVHRDLKPENILVTRQGIKLLDFGLARQDAAPLGQLDATVTRALTNQGEIVGTLQYMAPEQLQGRNADERSDLFAFGCVLYELISGKPAFPGEDAASIIAAVLEREPEPISIPPALDRIIRTCLAKDPAERFQSAVDLNRALAWALDPPVAGAAKMGLPSKWMAAGIMAAVLAVFGFGWLLLRPSTPADIVRYPLLLSRFSSSYGFMPPVLSPDGSRLVYIADTMQGRRQIFERRLDALDSQPVRGTDGATTAAWSPDSHRLVFAVDARLKTADLRTGTTREIGLTDNANVTLAWGADGAILYNRTDGPLFRITESGGTPAPASLLDASQEEVSHNLPSFCPDGRHFLYSARRKDGQTLLRLGVLGPPATGSVLEAAPPAACTSVPSVFGDLAYLVDMANDSLIARRLDLSSGALSTSPVIVGSGAAFLNARLLAQNARLLLRSRISAGSNGTLAYSLGGADAGTLTWHDRAGHVLEELPAAAAGYSPALTWDDRRVAVFRVSESGRDIWVTDLTRKTSQRLIFPSKTAGLPIWSPDGSRIAFAGDNGIYEAPATGGEARLVSPVVAWTQQYSADGRHILYVNVTKSSLELLPVMGEANPVEIAPPGPTYFPATFAPGEGFVAYTSSESGRPEVYVRAVPPASGKWIISTEGGGMAAWRGDGKELFYLSPDLKLMAVDISLSPKFQAGTAKPLFQTKTSGVLSTRNNYVVSRDGSRFLILTPPQNTQTDPVYVVVNWPSLLKKNASAK